MTSGKVEMLLIAANFFPDGDASVNRSKEFGSDSLQTYEEKPA
jgi:hypothetical protein